MPASRKARATILAPRSCPSRPGLATITRILLSIPVIEQHSIGPLLPAMILPERRLLVSAKHAAKYVAHFAERGVSPHAFQNIRHEVSIGCGRAAQCIERLPDSRIVTLLFKFREFFTLARGNCFINHQNINGPLFFC